MLLSLLCCTSLDSLQAQELRACLLQAEALSLDLEAPEWVRELAASLACLSSLGSSAAEVQALKVCCGIGLAPEHNLMAMHIMILTNLQRANACYGLCTS